MEVSDRAWRHAVTPLAGIADGHPASSIRPVLFRVLALERVGERSRTVTPSPQD